MRTQPPANLVSLLARLKLATPEQVAKVARRAGRLAGELTDFESVWVDALAQAGVLTPYQAAQINSGFAESLCYGPYVVTHSVAGPHWAECYAARHAETRREVRLYVVQNPQQPTADTVAALAQLLAESPPLRSPVSALVDDFGTRGELVWAACPAVEGTPAADWMVENGRFPAAAVLHIAREMAARLSDLQLLGMVHGDVAAAGLVLQESGHVVLPAPGLRGILRPHEGYSFNDLRPEAYDYLAPERIADGTAPNIASDVYACGGVWWHSLTGRPPFAGGNSLEKLKAVHAARAVNVCQFAPDAPDVLADTIEACLAHEPGERPASFARLCEMLGAPTRAGSAMLGSLIRRPASSWQVVRSANHRKRRASRKAQWAAGAAAVCVALLVALVPLLVISRRDAAQLAVKQDQHPAAPSTAPENRSELAAAGNTPAAADPRKPQLDPAVRPAAATLPVDPDSNKDLVLPTGKLLRIEQLDLKPHIRVRGQGGGRATVSVPQRGLLIACEDVTFEGIDFVRETPRRGARTAPGASNAMCVIRAQVAAFRGCSFSTTSDVPPVAIAWKEAPDGNFGGLTSELVLRDCVFAGTAAVVDCLSRGLVSVAFENSLAVDSGPLVRLHRAPDAGEPISLTLDHVTTRGDSAVLHCRYGRLDENPGSTTITVNESVLSGRPGRGLVILAGPRRPEPLVRELTWTGEGSIVTPQTAMLVWQGSGREPESLPEEELTVAGLVRGEVQFAGPRDGPPATSAVTRWQVPLRSADPPGANTAALSLPRR